MNKTEIISKHFSNIEGVLFGKKEIGKSLWDLWYHPTIRFLWQQDFDENNEVWYREVDLLQLAKDDLFLDIRKSMSFVVQQELTKIDELDQDNSKSNYYSILVRIFDLEDETDENVCLFLDQIFQNEFKKNENDPLLLCIYGGYQQWLLRRMGKKAKADQTDFSSVPWNRIILPKNYKFALEYYEKALSFDPDNYVILGLIGYDLGFHLNHEQHEDAIKLYDKSLGINPENKYILFYKAKWHKEHNEKEEEINCYIRILKIDPDNLVICKLLAETLLSVNNKIDAFKYYEIIISNLEIQKQFLALHPEILLDIWPLLKEFNRKDQSQIYFDYWLSSKGIDLLFNSTKLAPLYSKNKIENIQNIILKLNEQKVDFLDFKNNML